MKIYDFLKKIQTDSEFIKNNFKTKDEQFIAKMTVLYYKFEKEDEIDENYLLPDNFKIKDFKTNDDRKDREKKVNYRKDREKKVNYSILSGKVIEGLNSKVNSTMNSFYINIEEDKNLIISSFNKYEKYLKEILNNNFVFKPIKEKANKVINNINNNINKLNNEEKNKVISKRKSKMSI